MEMLLINGGRPLSGSVEISGSKNSALPILIATLLAPKTSVIKNVPRLADTIFLFDLLKSFGLTLKINDDEITIDATRVTTSLAHYEVVRRMRASVLVLSPLLQRMGEAKVSLPGGCAIGTRPIDIHLQGLSRLGADIKVSGGYINARLKGSGFKGAEYHMPLPSVGATENLVMAAALADGKTTLFKAAKEPEIVDLCKALNNAGAKITGAGTPTIEIKGVTSLRGLDHQVCPDRIEAGTFAALAAASGSELRLRNVRLLDLESILERFRVAGVLLESGEGRGDGLQDLIVKGPKRLVSTDLETAAHPGFPTDMQAQFMAAMTIADGECTIFERVFENRMMHVPELNRMGAQIELKKGVAKVTGQKSLSGAPVMATDLRASASLIIAALCANGPSEIRRIYHIDRGYQSIEKKLVAIGASIERISQKP